MAHINNDLPNGWALKLRQSCSLGERGKVISTHATYNEAEVKAKSLNHALTVFEILDIYGNKTLTARSAYQIAHSPDPSLWRVFILQAIHCGQAVTL